MEQPEVPTEHLHEHMEHHAKHSGERWTLGVALSSALLAALAAVASLQAGHHANEAMISQVEAANQWSYFQSKSIKESQLKGKMDILTALEKPIDPADRKKAEEYKTDKEEIQKHAEEKDQERHALSDRHLHRRHRRADQTPAVLVRQPGLRGDRPGVFCAGVFGGGALIEYFYGAQAGTVTTFNHLW
ncbi:MAG: DUF4337 family protein [Verrucomicrobia bacterium]|nr:DUF4337 family protein [Verrucomicrobiota bacterium]